VSHEEMMDRFRRFAAAPIDTLDLVPNMPVIILLGKLGSRAVR